MNTLRLFLVFAVLHGLNATFAQTASAQGFGNDPEYFLSGHYKIAEGTRQGILSIKMEISPNWKGYSLTQENNPSQIIVEPSKAYKLLGKFKPNKKAKKMFDNDLNYDVEVFYDEVIWAAPIEILSGQDIEKTKFDVKFDGQVCGGPDNSCIPIFGEAISVKFSGYYKDTNPNPKNNQPPVPNDPKTDKQPKNGQAASSPDENRISIGHGTLTGYLDKTEMFPGDSANLIITADIEYPYHVYEYRPAHPEGINVGLTLIRPAGSDQFMWSKLRIASEDPKPSLISGIGQHSGQITWTIPVTVPGSAKSGYRVLQGQIGIQTCSDVCDPPAGVEFVAVVKIGESAKTGKQPLIFSSTSYEAIKTLAKEEQTKNQQQTINVDLSKIEPQTLSGDDSDDTSLLVILGIALIGGFILNFMPCVLPVIGLKVMSFVQQAGQDRGKIFALNAWYSLGMLGVFWILAALAAGVGLAWGEQFNNEIFNVVMVSVVFVMALSFIGVWEIPIPGFVSSGAAGKAEQKEGPTGAILKGAIATLLATPCSGPGLATALTWCAGKSPGLIFLVFTFLGLGMAFPYIVIGLNPKLIRFLPKPGPWMETFKHLMGFVLLGTVVFMLTYFQPWQVVPTIAALFGLWAACWWIGKIPFNSSATQKFKAGPQALVFAGCIFAFCFMEKIGSGEYSIPGLQLSSMSKLSRMVDVENSRRDNPEEESLFAALLKSKNSKYELEPEQFSVDRVFEVVQNENKVVLVDFTADWCATCKVLESTVLHTKTVSSAIKENDVTFMVADWTSKSRDIGQLLNSLKSKQIPIYAIFTPADPYRPIVLNATNISRANVIAAIEKARDQNTSGEDNDPVRQASGGKQNKESRFDVQYE